MSTKPPRSDRPRLVSAVIHVPAAEAACLKRLLFPFNELLFPLELLRIGGVSAVETWELAWELANEQKAKHEFLNEAHVRFVVVPDFIARACGLAPDAPQLTAKVIQFPCQQDATAATN